MRPFRPLLAISLALAASGGLAACGESDTERRAKEANDAAPVPTSVSEAQKTAEQLEADNRELEKQDEKDRKDLAKDVLDAVGGSRKEAERLAERRAAEADQAARDTAEGIVSDAQAEVDKVREQAQEALDAAGADLDAATGN